MNVADGLELVISFPRQHLATLEDLAAEVLERRGANARRSEECRCTPSVEVEFEDGSWRTLVHGRSR